MSNISAYIILIIAVALGTAANGFAKSAQGFTVLIPSVITAITIVLCMYTLSLVMKAIPVGITYASFAGLCIVATVLVGIVKFNQIPNLYTIIGLCLIGNSRGYKTIIVMPETQTQEKKDILKSIGADLRLVPAKPYKDPNNYVKYSGKLAEDIKKKNSQGVFWANQFDNIANYKGHYETTGPEIWNQTEGKVDAFICASGTGGTIAGVGKALKEKNNNIKIVLSDPKGSALYNHIKHGELKLEGKSITEGIGSSRVTKNFEQAPIDDAYSINDHDALTVLFELLEKEGLSLGTSTGINVAGAIKLAKDLGPNHTIVTILCDKSDIYRSKMFNKKFLIEKELPYPKWL